MIKISGKVDKSTLTKNSMILGSLLEQNMFTIKNEIILNRLSVLVYPFFHLFLSTCQIYYISHVSIFILSSTDSCFVLSELFSVARHAGRSKPGSKPVQLYVGLSLGQCIRMNICIYVYISLYRYR